MEFIEPFLLHIEWKIIDAKFSSNRSTFVEWRKASKLRGFSYIELQNQCHFFTSRLYTYSIRVNNDSYFFEITTLFSCKQGNPKFKIFWPKLSKPGKTLDRIGSEDFRRMKMNKKFTCATPNSACRTDAVFWLNWQICIQNSSSIYCWGIWGKRK